MNGKRTLGIVLMAVAMLLPARVNAQKIIDWWSFNTGVDTSLWIDISGSYSTIIAGGNRTSAASGLQDIGFSFTCGALTHTKYSTNVNGTVRLGSTAMPASGYYTQPLGQNINTGPKIEPYGWHGLFDSTCYTRTALVGDSGSRVRVIETRMMNYSVPYTDSLYFTFQVQMFENGGIRIIYGHTDSGATGHQTQNGIAGRGSSSDKDVVFFDFATQTERRFNDNCTLYNAEGTWPVEGRWYMMAPDSNMCTYSVVSVTASNSAPDNVVLTNNNGGANDLRIVIPAVGLDTLWPATDSTLSLNRTFNPNTVYDGTVLRYCSNGQLSYRGNGFSFTTGCGPVSELPWLCDFTETISTNCWDMSQYTTTNNKWSKQNGALGFTKAMRCGNTSSQTYDEWLQTPVFTLPDTNGITIKWDYRSDLLNGVAPTVDVRVAPCTADGTVADSAWTTVMTLNEEVASAKTYYLSLNAYRGQTIRVAFVRTGTGGKYAALDNIMLYLQHVPIVELEAPISASLDDTVAFTARMITGVDSNVVWTWHSTLMDTTIVVNNLDSTACVLNFTYNTSGADTMSVVLSNAYGADTATAIVWVADCNAASTLPWEETFDGDGYLSCWEVGGWLKRTASYLFHDENNALVSIPNVMYANTTGHYLLTPAITIPATGVRNMKLWVECQPPLMVRLSPTASTDTANYTDTLLVVNHSISQSELWWQVADLEQYAGQTVRIGFFKLAGNQCFIKHVRVDYDTLPVIFSINGQAKTLTDSATTFTATLRRGSLDSIHYSWTSLHGGIITANALGDSMTVTYPSGIGTLTDTITLIATNLYGSDTMSTTLRVVDCSPQTSFPWVETFADGDVCWYKPEGCKWHDAIPNNNSSYEYLRHLYLNTRTDTMGSWIISKEIQLPTGISPTLRWKTASSNSGYHHLYSVLVTTAADYTDTANYTLLYTDSTTHPNFSNYDNHSASLAQYEGQTIHIAFHNHPWHMAPSAIGLYIDDVEVSASYEPQVRLNAVGAGSSPTYTYGDTAIFEAALEEGSTAGLSFTWHSTLLDSTWVTTGITAQSRLAYGLLGGTDTVSVIATNNYGSDTATVYTYSYIVFEPSITNFIAEGLDILQGDNEVETGDTTIYAITRAYSVTLGQTYSLRSSLMDTTVTVATTEQTCRIPLVYNVTGRDTVTAIITTLYGSDTATMQVEAVDCPAVGVPYLNTFDDSTDCHCWPGNWVAQSGRATSLNGPTWLVSPAIDIPADTPGVQLKWTTYDINTAMGLPIRLLVSPTGSKDHAMFTDTIMDGYTPYGAPDSVSLDAYLGQRIRVALVTNLQSRAYTFDNISIDYNRTAPQVTISAPAETTIPDSVSYTATINGCSSYGLDIMWHSSLLGTSLASSSLVPFNVAYSVGGVDTVTIIASNHYGADTAVAVVNVVDCNGRPVPFFEDFEGVTPTTWNVAGNLPLCWTAVSNGTNAAYAPHVIANNGYSYISNLPNNALFMVSGSAAYGNPTDVVLPRFAAPLNTLSIAFDYRCENAGYGTLQVGYYDTAGVFTAVRTMTSHTGNYLRDTVSIGATGADATQIVLRWTNGSTYWAVAVDNIEVFAGRLYVDSISSECARLAWTAVDGATGYHVTVGGVVDTVVGDTSLTFCGLTRNTQYTAGVAAIMGTDTGDYQTISFTTPCGVTLPWFEDFEGTSPLQCWTNLGQGGITLPQAGHEAYYSTFCHSGSKGLQIYTSNNSSSNFAVTPLIEHPGNELAISFWANHFENGGMTLEAGVLTVPGDTGSFVAMMECPLTSSPTRFGFVTRGVASDQLAVAFRLTGYTANGIIVDDISIEAITPCARLLNATSHALDARTAVLEWQLDTGSALTPDSVYITLSDLTSGGAQFLTVAATPQHKIFSNLSPGHRYHATLGVRCGNDLSDTIGTLVIPTANACDERRGNISSGWFLDNCDRPYCYSQTLYPATLAASVDTLFGIAYRLVSASVEQYPDSYNTYSYGPRIVDVYIGQTTLDSLASPISASSMTLAVQNYELPLTDTGWVHINFTNPVPLDGVSNLIVVLDDNTGAIYGDVYFGHHNDNYGVCFRTSTASYSYTQTFDPYNPSSFSSYPITTQIPDIQLLGGCSTNRCLQPNITLGDIDTHSVVLNWSRRGVENAWIAAYRFDGEPDWNIAGITLDTAYTLGGLNASTNYQVRVGSLCSGDTVWSDSLAFRTACGPVSAPYYQNFGPLYADCWSMSENMRRWMDNGHTYLWLAEDGEYVISPEITNPITSLRVRIIASGYTWGTRNFYVGVCDANGSNLTVIDTITPPDNSMQEFTVYLNNYIGNGHHIAIGSGTGYCSLDKVFIEEITSCMPVHHVNVSQLTDHSALFSWPPVDQTLSWAVYLDDSLLGITTTPSYAISGLDASTSYTVGVREICTPGDTADVTIAHFTTLCPSINLPWTEDFQSGIRDSVPECWYHRFRNYDYTNSGRILGGSGSNPNLYLYLYDSYTSTNPHHQDTTSANYLFSPMINAGNHDINVSLQAALGNSSVQVGIATDVTDTNTFVPIIDINTPTGTGNYVTYQFTTEGLALPPTYSIALRWKCDGSWNNDGGIYCAVDNIVVTAIPLPMHDLTLTVNDTTMGTVTGGGTYEEGTLVTIAAVANDGYRFVTWSDSVSEAVRGIIVNEDVALTAYFAVDSMPPAPDTVWRTVTVLYDNTMGSVSGGGSYMDSSIVTLTASPLDGYKFDRWDDGDTTNPRSILVVSDTTFTAHFSAATQAITQSSIQTISIYPNPSHGDVTVTVGQPSTVSVIDMTGRTVIPPTPITSSFILPRSSLSSGAYFLRATSASGTSVRKFLIK